jgi:cell wall-associated NlpC family hydrolase
VPRATAFPLAFLLLAALALSAGCRSRPPERVDAPPPASPGEALARAALAQLGSPYRYGGSTPEGFDCSGLVLHVHERAGIDVPRTAAQQFRAARPVDITDLAPGDLVFFRTQRRKVDHVGVYVGQGQFVHAPRSERPVSLARLDDSYYMPRFAGAGRFWR